MRIVWHSCAPWACSGYGSQTAIWTRKLQEMGHEVIISSYWGLSGSPTLWGGDDSHDPVTVLPGFGANYCSVSLGQHCKRVEPDLVITLGDIWVLDPNILRELPAAHWLPADCRPMSLADRQCIDASGAQLMAMGRWGYERFRTAGYNPVYCPHAIDTDIFKPAEDRRALRDLIDVGDNFVIGINAANNDAIRKALPEQMLAFAKFHQNHPDSLLALHTGIHQDGGQDLEAVAENLGIIDCIRVVDQYRYHSGLVTPGDLADWYNAVDVLSACTYGEGFGIPVIEAQACGVLVVSTDASVMTEINPHGIQVGGDPFWNGVHKGWWIHPSVSEIYRAFEEAYDRRGEDRSKLREFAMEYDAETVAGKYMKPSVDELLARMEKRTV
jgi:glycosyltransferase involved in cell wall biosynthesis